MTGRTTLPFSGSLGAERFRGPFARWPRICDAILALVTFMLVVQVEDRPGDAIALRPIGSVPIDVLVVSAVAATALFWRRSSSGRVMVVALVAWAIVASSADHATLGAIAMVALYSTGRYAQDLRWSYVAVAGVLLVVVLDGLLARTAVAQIAAGVVVMESAWYVGRRLRLRAERAGRLRREHAAEEQRIRTEERTRIARELHDVVAHRVSMMTVQAGAAKVVAAHDPEAAHQAMAAVEDAGRQALDELRHLLGVLRPDLDRDSVEHDGLGPQPGLADLPDLVQEVRRAGLEVSVTIDEVVAPLAARVELSAYRIVQEALTNVLKHSGPRTRTEVHVRSTACGRGICIEVVDDGSETRTDPVTDTRVPGHGIIGMRERALLLGGSLDAGPRPGCGFRVRAELPTGGPPQ
ncbi:sensor histidine kinase [Nocardia sp. CNY236]|uniref:sensor histidine kinase n=1 Tax=Nocardia sp. CNY236 TaxID=1169152 RepID=UPI00048BF372|nr:sensor histidine kinase [Nocardia sp. CNY236]